MSSKNLGAPASAGKATLHDYSTGEAIRPATAAELAESIAAAELDGGPGVFRVNGRRCYVADPTGPAADDCPPTLATGGAR